MRWKGRRQSTNVDDRRGRSGRVLFGGGLGAVLIGLVVYLLGGDPAILMETGSALPTASRERPAEENEDAEFVKVVLAETEDVWNVLFTEMGLTYREPQMVLFTGYDQSSCGSASAATGPFYCPADETVYIDLSFYQDLKNRFHAPGDFAMAYVIAHEVGHHVQYLLGITEEVQSKRRYSGEAESNALSVKLELQADFLAGVWAHYAEQTKDLLERGDIEEALRAANAIGDDRLQEEARGYSVPESFTHGTSEERMYWFKKGYQTGDLRQGNTFAGR